MTPEDKRAEIKLRIENGGFTVGAVIVESKYTALRNYLTGGEIGYSTLLKVEQALDRMEAAKAKSE